MSSKQIKKCFDCLYGSDTKPEVLKILTKHNPSLKINHKITPCTKNCSGCSHYLCDNHFKKGDGFCDDCHWNDVY